MNRISATFAFACSVMALSAAEPRTVPGLGLKLMPIPAGTFTMGSPGRQQGDGPQTRVTISQPFWLGQTEVTQSQWKALMGSDIVEQVRRQLADDAITRNAGKPLSARDGLNRINISDPHELVYKIADDVPVYWVSWEEAVEFCRRLTERERAANRLPAGHEYRLPTEAEWEYACRAGTTTANYADELDQIAWYGGWAAGRSPGGTAGPYTVATKRPNDWGLHDMLGNVWEWCGDWYALKLPGGSVRDPRGPAAGSILAAGGPGRVIRGGAWIAAPHVISAAGRIWQLPGQRESALGFRVALAPQISR